MPHSLARTLGHFLKRIFSNYQTDMTTPLFAVATESVRFKKENPAQWLGFVTWVARDCANSLLPDLLMRLVTNKPRYR